MEQTERHPGEEKMVAEFVEAEAENWGSDLCK
jgi:hypothetical protein